MNQCDQSDDPEQIDAGHEEKKPADLFLFLFSGVSNSLHAFQGLDALRTQQIFSAENFAEL